MQEVEQWCCRWSPTLGSLEDTHENVWGTKTYDPETDIEKPTVFFGLYGLPDFMALWKHKGPKAVLWAGSDIRHFMNGYWLDTEGEIRLNPEPIARWIDENCGNYVENEVEWAALLSVGIIPTVRPSFLGDVNDFPMSYEWSEKPKLYTSVSGNDFELYGWDRIGQLAIDNPNVEFHLYGNTVEWPTNLRNVFVHGRVPNEQMNEEIKHMQGALRLTRFDGFSEIIAKSLLMGQYPVSLIPYPHALKPEEIGKLHDLKEPNKGRDFYITNLNNYPWNVQNNRTT